MKNHISTMITVAGLAIAGPLSAHVMGGSPMDHAHPTFERAMTTYVLYVEDTQDKITVVWTPAKACAKGKYEQEYTVEITRTNATAAVYSLWTLGLQSLDEPTTFNVTTGQVMFADNVYGQLVQLVKDQPVKPAGLIPNPGNPAQQIVDDARISLAQFTGTKFIFTVKRSNRPGQTYWSERVIKCKDAKGHDNTPPD